MAQESPAKVKVKGINQVAIVVKDIQRTVENYWSILGIGPWDIYAWEAPTVYDRKYYGKPTWAREKIALAQVGAVQLELVQPVEGDSIYQDFLTEHGEGLHHLNFLVDDVDDLDETAEILAEEGFPTSQSGRIGTSEDKGGYNYIDIKPLRTIWEPVHKSSHLNAVPTRYPGTEQESPAKIKVKGITQIALVVKDLQRTTENYWSILGIGPWDISMLEAPRVKRTYYGKPAWAREKMGLVQVGGVQLELLEPVEGDSIYQDFITEHGEGLHHLQFRADDVDEAAEILSEESFPTIQSGRAGPPGQKGGYNYIYIEPLRAIWEPVGKSKSGEPTRYP